MIGIGRKSTARPMDPANSKTARLIRSARVNSVNTPGTLLGSTPGASRPTSTFTSGIDHLALHRIAAEEHRDCGPPQRQIAEHLHAKTSKLQVLVRREVHPHSWRLFVELVDRPVGECHEH